MFAWWTRQIVGRNKDCPKSDHWEIEKDLWRKSCVVGSTRAGIEFWRFRWSTYRRFFDPTREWDWTVLWEHGDVFRRMFSFSWTKSHRTCRKPDPFHVLLGKYWIGGSNGDYFRNRTSRGKFFSLVNNRGTERHNLTDCIFLNKLVVCFCVLRKATFESTLVWFLSVLSFFWLWDYGARPWRHWLHPRDGHL